MIHWRHTWRIKTIKRTYDFWDNQITILWCACDCGKTRENEAKGWYYAEDFKNGVYKP